MSIPLLILIDSVQDYLPVIESQGFRPILATTDQTRAQAIQAHGGQIRAVLTAWRHWPAGRRNGRAAEPEHRLFAGRRL